MFCAIPLLLYNEIKKTYDGIKKIITTGKNSMHNKLTMDNMKKLQDEMEYRLTTLRAEIAHEKMVAAAHGDRSENAEYKAACENYRNNDRRIQYILTMLSTAQIIEEEERDHVLGVNKRALVRFSDDEEKVELKLVTTLDRDPVNMLISIESDLGKALLNHKEGDTVEINAAGGSYTVSILKILTD